MLKNHFCRVTILYHLSQLLILVIFWIFSLSVCYNRILLFINITLCVKSKSVSFAVQCRYRCCWPHVSFIVRCLWVVFSTCWLGQWKNGMICFVHLLNIKLSTLLKLSSNYWDLSEIKSFSIFTCFYLICFIYLEMRFHKF